MFDTLALALLLFYGYSALLDPVATQYHRGVYVLSPTSWSFCSTARRAPGGERSTTS